MQVRNMWRHVVQGIVFGALISQASDAQAFDPAQIKSCTVPSHKNGLVLLQNANKITIAVAEAPVHPGARSVVTTPHNQPIAGLAGGVTVRAEVRNVSGYQTTRYSCEGFNRVSGGRVFAVRGDIGSRAESDTYGRILAEAKAGADTNVGALGMVPSNTAALVAQR